MACGPEGPISDPKLLNAALKRALTVVKSGRPALVDVVCQARCWAQASPDLLHISR